MCFHIFNISTSLYILTMSGLPFSPLPIYVCVSLYAKLSISIAICIFGELKDSLIQFLSCTVYLLILCYLQGKGDGLQIERSGLHDNWDDAEGYYSKSVINLSFLFLPSDLRRSIIMPILFKLDCWLISAFA